MSLTRQCLCGHPFADVASTADLPLLCPRCGRVAAASATNIETASVVGAETSPAAETSAPPPSTPAAASAGDSHVPQESVLRRMFEALLDPRAIQWQLLIGGSLCVLGIVVWLVSKGVFENKLVLATALGAGTLAVLGAGWATVLRTRYRLAGQALTFLGCVVAPLNLWFYHAQNLVTVENRLWIGGVACCVIYAATVHVLHDPLFLYACEGGVTLTMLLLLADLGKFTDAAWLSLFLMALGLTSLHAERAFSPAETAAFPRRRFGMPLFWSGQGQVAAALAVLLGSQLLGWFEEPARVLLGSEWSENLLTPNHLVAAGVWLAAAYAYLYSDLIVRQVGAYLGLAGACLVMAEVTLLIGYKVGAESVVALMAATATGLILAHEHVAARIPRTARILPSLAALLAVAATAGGVVLHVRAASPLARDIGWDVTTGGQFVAALVIAAAAHAGSAWMLRRSDPRSSASYLALSAAVLVTATAGLLRTLGLTAWSQQSPWLMLTPLAYLTTSRIARNRQWEKPLYWLAQGVAVGVLALILGGFVREYGTLMPRTESREALSLALSFAEACGFYILAAALARRPWNVPLAAASGCGAVWQLTGYWGLDPTYNTMLYAGLGVVLLAVARGLGIEASPTEAVQGVGETAASQRPARRQAALAAMQTGNGILAVAMLAALMQGLAGLARSVEGWTSVTAMTATAAAAALGGAIVPSAAWRRLHAVGAVALSALTLLRINALIDLSGWQKLEIVSVVAGLLLLAAAHAAVFREPRGRRSDVATFGLALGSLLAVAPLVVAVLYHRWSEHDPSLPDELALVTVTTLLAVTGSAWRIKATTLCGGAALSLYLVVLVASLTYHPQVAIGVYLAVGGAAVFGLGVALSIYRDRLLELPNRVARREGVFRILNWR